MDKYNTKNPVLNYQRTNFKVLNIGPAYRRTRHLPCSLRWYQIIPLGDRGKMSINSWSRSQHGFKQAHS